jgi:hypothetical protein
VDSLIAALAGGSIGSVVTLLAGVPAQVKRHNTQVQQWDDDLGQWVSDECVELERKLIGNKNSAGNQLYSGSYLTGAAHIKEQFLHAYRDEERGARQRRAALLDDEGLRHKVWRRATLRGPLPELHTPDHAAGILDQWRKEVRRDGDTAPVSDPTHRPLEWAIEKYADDPDWPPV